MFSLGEQGSPPLTVNNRGQVLYQDRVWWNNATTQLPGNPSWIQNFTAKGMNDNGQIIGEGEIYNFRNTQTQGGPVVEVAKITHSGLVWWDDKDSTPVPVDTANSASYALTVWDQDLMGLYGFNFPADCLVDNDGRLVAYEFVRASSALNLRFWSRTSTGFAATADSELIDTGFTPAFSRSNGYCWGPILGTLNGRQTRLLTGSSHRNLGGNCSRISPMPPEGSAVKGAFGAGLNPLISSSGWLEMKDVHAGLDISDKNVVIASASTLHQDDYTGPFINWAPKLPDERKTPILADSSQTGWLLSKTGQPTLSVPVTITDDVENTGVDSFSLTSPEGCAKRGNWQDWIMVPAGGNPVAFKIDTLASTDVPLTLQLPRSSVFANASDQTTINSQSTTLTVKSTSVEDAGNEGDLKVSLGGTGSMSSPIGLKYMKHRTVKVTVCVVPKNNIDDIALTKQEIQDYLNSVFSPQINVVFDVLLVNVGLVNWDIEPSNNYFDGDSLTAITVEQGAVSNALFQNPATAAMPEPDITIFFVGMSKQIRRSWQGDVQLADGFTMRDNRTCWVRGSSTPEYHKIEALDVIAHEVGHVFTGPWHPDGGEGVAVLPKSDDNKRLMAARGSEPGTGKTYPRVGAKLLVKGEWDEAERWLKSRFDSP